MTDDLMAFLRQLPPGAVPEDRRPELERHLAPEWDNFSGADSGGMESYKLHDRVEGAEWNAPILAFFIERHGPTVQGSSRAPHQHWSVNLDTMTADCEESGYTQLYPRSPSLKVEPIAREIADAILHHEQHPNLDWLKNGGVRPRSTKLLGDRTTAKQTMESRRRRFLKALDSQLAPHGWSRRSGGSVYRQHDPAGDRP